MAKQKFQIGDWVFVNKCLPEGRAFINAYAQLCGCIIAANLSEHSHRMCYRVCLPDAKDGEWFDEDSLMSKDDAIACGVSPALFPDNAKEGGSDTKIGFGIFNKFSNALSFKSSSRTVMEEVPASDRSSGNAPQPRASSRTVLEPVSASDKDAATSQESKTASSTSLKSVSPTAPHTGTSGHSSRTAMESVSVQKTDKNGDSWSKRLEKSEQANAQDSEFNDQIMKRFDHIDEQLGKQLNDRFFGILNDITDIKKAGIEFIKLTRDIQQTNDNSQHMIGDLCQKIVELNKNNELRQKYIQNSLAGIDNCYRTTILPELKQINTIINDKTSVTSSDSVKENANQMELLEKISSRLNKQKKELASLTSDILDRLDKVVSRVEALEDNWKHQEEILSEMKKESLAYYNKISNSLDSLAHNKSVVHSSDNDDSDYKSDGIFGEEDAVLGAWLAHLGK